MSQKLDKEMIIVLMGVCGSGKYDLFTCHVSADQYLTNQFDIQLFIANEIRLWIFRMFISKKWNKDKKNRAGEKKIPTMSQSQNRLNWFQVFTNADAEVLN